MIPDAAVSLLAVAGFGWVLWRSALGTVAHGALGAATEGVSAMLDRGLSDDAKERAVRRAGFALVLAAATMALWILAALLVAGLPVFVADLAGVATLGAVTTLMLRWEFLLGVTVLGMVAARLLRIGAGTATQAKANRYSTADRMIHMLAFAHPGVLKAASWIEDRLIARAAAARPEAPIFITSLARGGTTALLNALHDVPGVATHTYRDMPFVTAPVLWSRLSGQRQVTRHERAHGDGLQIDLDSPEALEEVLWTLCWPEHYTGNRITPWVAADRDASKEAFLARHMSKLVSARGADRYCSKNNANIARIPFLAQSFPDAHIVVPVRHPGAHAASLWRQHLNFGRLQRDDPFVRRYMCDLGHFEFGQIHKPLGFDGTDDQDLTPDDTNYWLRYWIAAFREVLKHRAQCRLVFQDDLRAAPQETMQKLCASLNLPTGEMPFDGYFRATPDIPQPDLFDPDLYQQAEALYSALRART